MLGKKLFLGGTPVPVTKADKAVRSRLDKLERKLLTGKNSMDAEAAKKVEKLESSMEDLKKRVVSMQPPVSSKIAADLARTKDGLEAVRRALVKLPKGDQGGLIVRVSNLEKEYEDLADKLNEQTKLLVSLYGVKGDNGRVGRLEKVADRLEEKLDKVAWLHFKVLGLALGGGVAGGFLAKFLL